MATILFFKEKKEQFKKNLKHLCSGKSIWNRKIEEKDNVYMFLLH